jgi:hypothetical protein
MYTCLKCRRDWKHNLGQCVCGESVLFIPEHLKVEAYSLFSAGRFSDIEKMIKDFQNNIISDNNKNQSNTESHQGQNKINGINLIDVVNRKSSQIKSIKEQKELKNNINLINFERNKEQVKISDTESFNASNNKATSNFSEMATFIFAACLVVLVGYYMRSCTSEDDVEKTRQTISSQIAKYPISQLSISDFKLNINDKNLTQIQRDLLVKSYQNIRVIWTGKIKDIEKDGEYFSIEMENDFSPKNDIERLMSNGVRFMLGTQNYSHIDSVCGTTYLSPQSEDDIEIIAKLKKGDGFRYDGVINRITQRGCIIVKPAILSKDQESVQDRGFKSEYLKQQTDNATQILNEIKKGIEDGVSKGLEDPIKE